MNQNQNKKMISKDKPKTNQKIFQNKAEQQRNQLKSKGLKSISKKCAKSKR